MHNFAVRDLVELHFNVEGAIQYVRECDFSSFRIGSKRNRVIPTIKKMIIVMMIMIVVSLMIFSVEE